MATKYNGISLKMSDNGGYILSYDCEHMSDNEGDLRPQRYEYKTETYDDSAKAIARMVELVGKNKEE